MRYILLFYFPQLKPLALFIALGFKLSAPSSYYFAFVLTLSVLQVHFLFSLWKMKLYISRRRRQHQRLRSVALNEENETNSISKGSQKNSRKFRVTPKLRVKFSSSMVILRRFRDAYVEMMLCFGGRLMQLNNGNFHLFKKSTTSRFSA